MKKIILLVLPILAFLGGAVLGEVMTTTTVPAAPDAASAEADAASGEKEGKQADHVYFKFPNQFFVPLMQNGEVRATMILSLTVEMPKDKEEAVYAKEHKLRDAMLRTLMIAANTGGFNGNFTSDVQMGTLRRDLLKSAQDEVDPAISAILIEDIARQDAGA